LSQFTVGKRYRRSYSPPGLMVLRGPKEKYEPGSHWVVGDKHGYAELRLMNDSKAYNANSLYIENIVVKEPLRGRGYGRELYQKIERFAQNIGTDYIQIDSESDVIGFWHNMGFKELDVVYYQNKTAMNKKLRKLS